MEHTNNYRPGDIILTADKITKSFGDLVVLEDYNLSLRQGEFVSLVGPTGCGKTTLLKVLAGLMKDYSGTIDRRSGRGLFASVVFQDRSFFPWLNIMDNIKICLNDLVSDAEKEYVAASYLKKVRLLDFMAYLPGELSEGMIQRANVARALASRSQLVLMDEPFVHLDFLSRISLQQLVLEILASESRTVLFVTHNIHEAITLADRVIVMSSRPGKIAGEFMVDIPGPRDVNRIRTDPRYLDLVEKVTELLTVEVEKSQRQFDLWIKSHHWDL